MTGEQQSAEAADDLGVPWTERLRAALLDAARRQLEAEGPTDPPARRWARRRNRAK